MTANLIAGRRVGWKRVVSLAFPLFVICEPLSAQLEEVVVTATRRAETLQSTPLAVTAVAGDELARLGVYDTVGLSNFVPNVTVATEGAKEAVFINIRGVSQSERRNASDPTTAFYVDGAYVPRMSGVNAYYYDLDRIEVLRGPQGTLYGRNSTSGVVNVITRKPDTEMVSGDIELTLGDYNWTQVRGALNIPFSDNVAARFAFVSDTRDGFRENGPIVEDGDDADDQGIRAHLLWNVGDATSLLFTADVYRRGGVGTVVAGVPCPEIGCNVPTAPDPARTNPLTEQGFRNNKDTNFKLNLSHSFSSVDLDFLLSSREHNRDMFLDTVGLGIPFFLPPTGRNVLPDAQTTDKTESDSVTTELTFSSTGDGSLRWIIGGFYLDETINTDFSLRLLLPNGLHFKPRWVERDMSVESKAVFGNLIYDVSDTFTLRGGIRYTEDEKNSGGINNPSNPTQGSYQIITIDELGIPVDPAFPRAELSNPSWDETTFMAGIDWNLSEESLAYVKYSTGYKAGGYSIGTVDFSRPTGFMNVSNLIEYEPEKVDALEGGWKRTFNEGAARMNLAGFYYDYQDKEETVATVLPGGIVVNNSFNAASATIYGVELETSFLYGSSGGQLDLNVGWLDATYDEFRGLDDPLTPMDDELDLAGGRMTNAPEWNLTAVWTLGEWSLLRGSITPRIQFHYKSDFITRPHDQPVDRQESYTRTNASLSWESDEGRLYVEAFVNNIEDEDIQTVSFCAPLVLGAGGPIPGLTCNKMYQPPRTYGVRLGYLF